MQGCFFAFLFAAVSLMHPTLVTAACLKPNSEEVAEGKLGFGKFKDAEAAFVLLLSTPECLDAEDESERVASTRTIHVYSANAAVQKMMRSLIGKTVQVTGKAYAQHTAHHHTPIVMEVSKIGRLR